MIKTITLSSDEHFLVYCGDHERYKLIKKENREEHSWRHGYGGTLIFQDSETGKFYETGFRNSSKDGMAWSDMNWGEQKCFEVEPKKQVTTFYEYVSEDSSENSTHTVTLTSVKDPDQWNELCHALGVEKEVKDKYLEFGEYADLELTFDKELNLISGKLLEQ